MAIVLCLISRLDLSDIACVTVSLGLARISHNPGVFVVVAAVGRSRT